MDSFCFERAGKKGNLCGWGDGEKKDIFKIYFMRNSKVLFLIVPQKSNKNETKQKRVNKKAHVKCTRSRGCSLSLLFLVSPNRLCYS